jgi:class 3 adenylate cyclase
MRRAACSSPTGVSRNLHISKLQTRYEVDQCAWSSVSNVASRLCDEAKPGQILISPRVLTKVEYAVKVEPVVEFELKGIRRPLAAYNVLSAIA